VRAIEIGFERDDALIGGGEPLVEAVVLLAQRFALADLMRELRFQIGDLRAAISMAISTLVASAVRSRFYVLARPWRNSLQCCSDAASFFSD
jgi:hypothetical protein